ncbi:pectinesterase family protein [Microbulbifer hainanensis]|uniref:pectinesterase family protein n=1 Tax=Microbulbifer hainanensis TaxID=2735675 RepID=UPI001D01324D|nr:pectinesterase family protein [Microbulbifer hainanensis]
MRLSIANTARLLALTLCSLLVGTAYSADTDTQSVDAIVDAGGRAVETGRPVYRSIGAALAAAPADGDTPFLIFVRGGHYREKLVITRPNVTLRGAGRDKTVISYDAYSGARIPGTEETWRTSGSATLIVRATNFRAEHLTIENSFDFLGNDALAADDPQKVHHSQAVALMTDTGSDRALFRDVRLSGYQDTLYVNAGRSAFVNSVVEGNVDFIFGAGTALFLDSDIVSRKRARTDGKFSGYVTAPSTDIERPFGLVFVRCRLLKETGVKAGSVALGRPWHPTTDFNDGRYADPDAIGASVFIDTYMDDHIVADGWTTMRGTSRDGSKSTVFRPDNSRFFEYRSRGPGAANNPARRQLDEPRAEQFTPVAVLGDWRPLD